MNTITVLLCMGTSLVVWGALVNSVEAATVTFEGNTFDVTASLSNGSVESMEVDADFTSLIVIVETSDTEDDELMIILPRALIDAKTNGGDDEFIILVDGEEEDYEESNTTGTERTLAITIPAGAEEVEIIGSQVVPEFPLGVMGAMGAIVAATVLFSRFKKIQTAV